MIKNYLEAITALLGFAAVIWRIAEVKNQIYKEIANLKELLIEKNNATSNKLDKHLTEYEIRKQWIDYVTHGLDQKIDHKSERFMNELKDLEKSKKESNDN